MAFYPRKYDIIVIGAGHAGCEAALAAARMGCTVLLLAIDLDKVAAMPCSPSIGGTAKGHLVKEIDALGGEMARITDQTAIQYKTLNTRKGPAVQATRTQNDKVRYHVAMKAVLEAQSGLELKEGLVTGLLLEEKRVRGVQDRNGLAYRAESVIIAAGTFLGGRVHIGSNSYSAGRAGEFAAAELAEQLRKSGFSVGRMKTGTPPRLAKSSIDFTCFARQPLGENPRPFSFTGTASRLPQLPTYIGHVGRAGIELVRKNLSHSALYGGHITGVPARYCPSFEDKAVRFPDKESHQIILEQEGLDTEEVYVSGLGNSLPPEIQVEFVHAVPGLKTAEIMRFAYAIEYDYINPLELLPTLETKSVAGLFLAGQVNGTSGYEEAAAQGLWAGINAACKLQQRPPFLLDRSEAYMGVMIDDLVTRGTGEPYRMFTSRAEYRLMLREDNADLRLTEKGHALGLVSDEQLERVREHQRQIDHERKRLAAVIIKPSETVNTCLEKRRAKPIQTGVHLDQLLKRAELDYEIVGKLSPPPEPLPERVTRQVEIAVKYEGYIDKQLREIEKFKDLERIRIPENFDYAGVHGLSNELKEKLTAVKPLSLGQVSRIDGMTPAGLSVLMIAVKAATGASLSAVKS